MSVSDYFIETIQIDGKEVKVGLGHPCDQAIEFTREMIELSKRQYQNSATEDVYHGRSWDELSEFERMTWVVSYTEAAVEMHMINDSEK